MKTRIWAVLLVFATAFGYWAIFDPWFHEGIGRWLLVSYCCIHPVGAFWMIYASLREEKRPLGYVLLAFVPYSFLWYYFGRARHVPRRGRGGPASGSRSGYSVGPESERKTAGPGGSARTPEKAIAAKDLAWLAFLCGTSLIALWQFASAWPAPGVVLPLRVLFFLLHPAGAVWMIWHLVRSKGVSTRLVLLAMIPYSFVWYYFERVRPARSAS